MCDPPVVSVLIWVLNVFISLVLLSNYHLGNGTAQSMNVLFPFRVEIRLANMSVASTPP